MMRGDEDAYRRVTLLDPNVPSHQVADARIAKQFAAIRLWMAAERRLDLDRRARRGHDRAGRLMVNDLREAGRKLRQFSNVLEFQIDGDRAAARPLEAEGFGFRRVGGKWFMVPEVEEITDQEYLAALLRHQRAVAAAHEAGRQAIVSGEARTVADVNRVIRQHLPEAPG